MLLQALARSQHASDTMRRSVSGCQCPSDPICPGRYTDDEDRWMLKENILDKNHPEGGSLDEEFESLDIMVKAFGNLRTGPGAANSDDNIAGHPLFLKVMKVRRSQPLSLSSLYPDHGGASSRAKTRPEHRPRPHQSHHPLPSSLSPLPSLSPSLTLFLTYND